MAGCQIIQIDVNFHLQKFLIKNLADKIQSKNYKGVNLTCLMPIRVNAQTGNIFTFFFVATVHRCLIKWKDINKCFNNTFVLTSHVSLTLFESTIDLVIEVDQSNKWNDSGENYT